jgi:adenosylcobinamide kinase/adenosylcobinamide-phosphate guanylyltransferase
MSITLLLGGARAGKSRYAQEMASRLGRRVLYVATADGLDAEMNARIEAHRASRPSSWRTLEAREDVARAIEAAIGDAEVVIVDCVTLLVSNLAGDDDPDVAAWEKRVVSELESLMSVAGKAAARFIIVSNEVGLGIVPVSPLARAYRDVLGMANQMLARHADDVHFLVAGIPICLKGGGSNEGGLSMERG